MNPIKPKLEFPEYNIYEVKIKCQLDEKKENKWRSMRNGGNKK